MDALNLTSRHPLFDVEIQPDQRLGDPDRLLLPGRGLDRVDVHDMLMDERRITSPERGGAQLVVGLIGHEEAPAASRRAVVFERPRDDNPGLRGCRLRAVTRRSPDVCCDRMGQLAQDLRALLDGADETDARER